MKVWELKFYFYPSAGGLKKKLDKALFSREDYSSVIAERAHLRIRVRFYVVSYWFCALSLFETDMVVQAKDDLLRVLAGEIRDKDDDLEAATTRLEVRPKSARSGGAQRAPSNSRPF